MKIQTHKLFFICASLGATISLTSCSDAREAFGMTNKSPDEFAVVDHPPLSMPPDYALRPPRPGYAENMRGSNPSEKAAQALYGDSKMEAVPQQGVRSLQVQNLTPAEQAIVTQTGATQADPAIRSQLAADSGNARESRKLLDNLLFWKKPQPQGEVVLAPAEAKRLSTARATNQPVNAGATPAIAKGKTTEIQ